MKHSSNRDLFDYWNRRRSDRAAPERSEIEPGAIRHLLADAFILDFAAHAGHPFRIAGTRVCALFGRELKGAAFLDLWADTSTLAMRDLLAVMAEESVGVVASVSAVSANASSLELELLMLPLSHRGRMDARILGGLVPTERTRWLGANAVTGLTLGTLRYLGTDVATIAAPRVVPDPPRGRIRNGLTVYDGGQS